MLARLLTAALGIWLMAAPSVLGYAGPGRINHLVTGPLVASFAIVALWQVTRPLRWAGLLAGVWLVAAPWLLGGRAEAFHDVRLANATLTGVALIALAFVRGRVDARFGGGWSALWRDDDDARRTRAASEAAT